MIAVVAAGGSPVFLPWRFGLLDPAGSWDLSPVTVPPGLAGLTVDFQAFAGSSGGFADSDPETVQFY